MKIDALTHILKIEQQNYDVDYYRIDLIVNPETETISGCVSMTAHPTIATLSEITLDFHDNMAIDSILSAGQKLTYKHIGSELIIYLSPSYLRNEAFLLAVHYHGRPMATGGFAPFQFSVREDVPVIWTLSEPFGAPAWWPCKDDPADKADSVDIIITVPQPMVVASNGVLIEERDNGDGTTTFFWSERYPISTYLVSLAITNYETFSDYYRYTETDSMEVRYYVYPEDIEAAKRDFAITVDMIAFFASVFGEYPFLREKYGLAQFPWGGAMEHQTCTSYGDNLITGDNQFDYINAHELAHQWFGDLVTIREWSHIWLNEGFASYAEALWFEHLGGQEALTEYMRSQDRGFFPTSVYVTDSTNISALFSYTVYDKGAWVLHMLRHVMGDDRFFPALRAYAIQFAYRNAVTEDFQRICESFYGKPLEWFFKQWVYGYYRPLYEYQWYDSSYANEHLLILDISQVQLNTGLFKMPLDVIISTASGGRSFVIWDSSDFQSFRFVLDEEPLDLKIDPDGWVLKSLRRREVTRPFTLYPSYPNPFHKTTTIAFDLPYKGKVVLDIYNLLGQRVTRLIDEIRFNGSYSIDWDGRGEDGELMPSGLYFCKILFDERFLDYRKMIKL